MHVALDFLTFITKSYMDILWVRIISYCFDADADKRKSTQLFTLLTPKIVIKPLVRNKLGKIWIIGNYEQNKFILFCSSKGVYVLLKNWPQNLMRQTFHPVCFGCCPICRYFLLSGPSRLGHNHWLLICRAGLMSAG